MSDMKFLTLDALCVAFGSSFLYLGLHMTLGWSWAIAAAIGFVAWVFHST